MLDIIARVCQKRAGKLCKFRKLKKGGTVPPFPDEPDDGRDYELKIKKGARCPLPDEPDLRLERVGDLANRLGTRVVACDSRPETGDLGLKNRDLCQVGIDLGL